MHKLKWLRAIHRTHHTATVLTPLTLLRVHPLEISLAQIRNSISYSLSLSLSVYLFPGPVTAWDILGVNVFGFLFNFLGSNLRHTAIDLSFGKLEYIFISPRMHQLHHSDDPKYFNKNFGVSLSIWDLMFGSFYKPTKEEMKSIRFGFPFKEKNEEVDLRVAIIAPLKKNT